MLLGFDCFDDWMFSWYRETHFCVHFNHQSAFFTDIKRLFLWMSRSIDLDLDLDAVFVFGVCVWVFHRWCTSQRCFHMSYFWFCWSTTCFSPELLRAFSSISPPNGTSSERFRWHLTEVDIPISTYHMHLLFIIYYINWPFKLSTKLRK